MGFFDESLFGFDLNLDGIADYRDDVLFLDILNMEEEEVKWRDDYSEDF